MVAIYISLFNHILTSTLHCPWICHPNLHFLFTDTSFPSAPIPGWLPAKYCWRKSNSCANPFHYKFTVSYFFWAHHCPAIPLFAPGLVLLFYSTIVLTLLILSAQSTDPYPSLSEYHLSYLSERTGQFLSSSPLNFPIANYRKPCGLDERKQDLAPDRQSTM